MKKPSKLKKGQSLPENWIDLLALPSGGLAFVAVRHLAQGVSVGAPLFSPSIFWGPPLLRYI